MKISMALCVENKLSSREALDMQDLMIPTRAQGTPADCLYRGTQFKKYWDVCRALLHLGPAFLIVDNINLYMVPSSSQCRDPCAIRFKIDTGKAFCQSLTLTIFINLENCIQFLVFNVLLHFSNA